MLGRCPQEEEKAEIPTKRYSQFLDVVDCAARLGLDVSNQPRETDAQKCKLRKFVSAYKSHLADRIDSDLLQSIIDSPPRPYPTQKPMEHDSRHSMAINGRRFEILMLQVSVEYCECCGRTTPVQTDMLLDKDNSTKMAHDPIDAQKQRFRRHHLASRYRKAYRCQCSRFCRGDQFYCEERPSHIDAFKLHHRQRHPANVQNVSSVSICEYCYAEFAGKSQSLAIGRTFSSRNGFGPVPHWPERQAGESEELTLGRELNDLLRSLTRGEEAAIRQITPLLSINRLKGGNIGSKGLVHCVYQKSRWHHLLPNLPDQCANIVVQRQSSAGGSPIPSLRFEKKNITRVLQLAFQLKVPSFQHAEFSAENLAVWPESGNLMDLCPRVTIPEEAADADANANANANAPTTPTTPVASAPPEDLGPAPLQNDVEEPEIFTGTELPNARAGSIADAAINGPEMFNQLEECLETRINNPDHASTEPGHDAEPALQPTVQFNQSGDTATIPQSDAMPTGGFVDMRKTPYAWARAFPSVFPLVYVDGRIDVWGDPTGWQGIRERSVNWDDWANWLMWSSDGFAASHPTLALVILNDVNRRRLHQQGSVAISLDDSMDATTTAEDWLGRIRADRDKLKQSLNYFAGNVRGTDQYWNGVLKSFQATAHYQSYVKAKEMNVFHTGSLAEYHDPFLRELLSKYVATIDSQAAGQQVIDDDATFQNAVRDYKHVVTHFFACKTETWISNFLVPVIGLQAFSLVYEFAKSRGAIHFHGCGYATSEFTNAIDKIIASWGGSVYAAMKNLDEYITNAYSSIPEPHQVSDPLDPHNTSEGIQRRTEFLQQTEEGKARLASYEKAIADAHQVASSLVGRQFEQELGCNACHPGVVPSEWVRPGGDKQSTYRTTPHRPPFMQTKEDVLEKRELKQFKFQREDDLYCRSVNITNHAYTHRCSSYCWRQKLYTMPFDPARHKEDHPNMIKAFDKPMPDGTMQRMVQISVHECRMGFGNKRLYGLSEDKDHTGGQIVSRRPM